MESRIYSVFWSKSEIGLEYFVFSIESIGSDGTPIFPQKAYSAFFLKIYERGIVSA